jgi:hypothetical protein
MFGNADETTDSRVSLKPPFFHPKMIIFLQYNIVYTIINNI